MDWVSFISGGLVTAFTFGLFASEKEDDEVDEMEQDHEEDEDGLIVNGHVGRNVTLSCQTCRKLKKHKEIEPNLYQCMKCKRHVDLRRKSS